MEEITAGTLLKIHSLKELRELYIHATTDLANDPEQLHMVGDSILIKALELMALESLSIHDRNDIEKIIKLHEDNPAWYS